MLTTLAKLTVGVIAVSAIASAAVAYDPVVLARGWYRVDRFAGEACTGEVGTNGQFYVISVRGLAPGRPALLTITNGDMTPIARSVRANGDGEWREYYIPFRPNRGEGGKVEVTLASQDCTVPLGFDWQRRKGWDVPPPLVPR